VVQGVVIHELGHAIAARRAGMVVLAIQVMRLRLEARRHGWTVRWTRSPFGGHVLAVHDPARPMREQYVALTWGGPAANAIACAAFTATAWWAPEPAWVVCVLAAGWNGVFALASLLPYEEGVPSDGLNLARWYAGMTENHPSLAVLRLVALSLSGVTSDRLPPEAIAALREDVPYERVVRCWSLLKAHQNRAEWSEATAMSAAIDAAFAALDDAHAQAMQPLRRLFDLELAFSRALAVADAPALDALPATDPDEFTWIPLRVLALKAALAGDARAMDRQLDASAHAVEDQLDKAWRASEALMRDRVRASLRAVTMTAAR
jgi:hypothetical protein